MKLGTKHLTLMALLIALYVVVGYLPGIPVIGSPDSTIDLTRGIEMLYGYILGPIWGSATAFMGALIGKTLKGGGFGMFFTPLALTSALIAGCLYKEKIYFIKGWHAASITFGIIIVGWYLTETGRSISLYAIFHILSFLIILILREKITELLHSENIWHMTLGVAISSLSATMAAHLLGNIIFTLLVNPEPLFYMSILPVSLTERIIFTGISSALSPTLIKITRQTYPELI